MKLDKNAIKSTLRCVETQCLVLPYNSILYSTFFVQNRSQNLSQDVVLQLSNVSFVLNYQVDIFFLNQFQILFSLSSKYFVFKLN